MYIHTFGTSKTKQLTMKKLIIALSAIALFSTAQAQQGKFDVMASKVKWEAFKVGGAHNGTIGIQYATYELKDGKPASIMFSIDMNNIVCLDIESPEYNQKLIGHLKSEDFFNSAKFATATFKSTELTPMTADENGNNYMVKGIVNIKGHEEEIKFPAKIEVVKGEIRAHATLKIDRSKFDVRYGSKSFFEGLGDKVIEDMFNIEVNATGKVG